MTLYNKMMIEISPDRYPAVIDLISTLDQAVLPRAVIEGTTPGWVFADDKNNPQSILIGLPCGFLFGAGKAPEGDRLTAVVQIVNYSLVPRSQAEGNFGFLFSFSGRDWIDCLPALLPGRNLLSIFRRSFTFDLKRFAALERKLAPLPEGFELREIDEGFLREQPGVLQEVLNTWASADAFLKHGCGAAVMRGSEVASICFSAFSTAERMEIAVATAEPYRRHGFARYAAAAFIRRCLDLGKQPNWECFWDNEASIQLAQRLGYTFLNDYPIFYWEERLANLPANGNQ
jgi:RimJ/RimL family protein N-acetyltransferase